MLGIQAFLNFQTNITSNYEDYPTGFLLIAGWGVAAAALVAGVLLSLKRWDTTRVAMDIPDEVTAGESRES